jgi:hypothetical protein
VRGNPLVIYALFAAIVVCGLVYYRDPSRNAACEKLGGNLLMSGECTKISVTVIQIPAERAK